VATRAIVELTERDHGWEELQRELRQLTNGPAYARAGVIGPKAGEEHANEEGAPVTVADIALFQEFGTRTIPERSVIRAGFDGNRAGYLAQLQTLIRAVYEGRMSLRGALGIMGLRMTGDQRKLITDGAGIPPPLADSTVAQKGSSRAWIDTGQVWRALLHDVQIDGEEASDGGAAIAGAAKRASRAIKATVTKVIK
jgi:hypothetical protein